MAAQVTDFSGTLPSRTAGQTTAQFNTNANDLFTWLTGDLVDDINTLATEAEADAATAETKATEAASSATTAAGHVTTAAGHVTTAAGHATTAEGHKDTAETAAAAAQAAAGLPSLTGSAGKALSVNSGEDGVEWSIQGALIPISETTLSNDATLELTIPSTYDKCVLEFHNVEITTAAQLLYQSSTDGGSTFDSGTNDYEFICLNLDDADTALTFTSHTSDGGTKVILNPFGGDLMCGNIELYSPANADQTTFMFRLSADRGSGLKTYAHGFGARVSSADVDAIKIYASSGNLISGTVKFYGVR